MQSFDSMETYAYETSKYLVSKTEEFKCSNIIKQNRKWLTLTALKEIIKEHNPNWPEISGHPCRILIIGGSESGKANSLLKLINQEPDIDKIS